MNPDLSVVPCQEPIEEPRDNCGPPPEGVGGLYVRIEGEEDLSVIPRQPPEVEE